MSYIKYILLGLKNSFFFRLKYLIEKIGKIVVIRLNHLTGSKIPFLFLFREDYLLENSDGKWKIKHGSDYDTLISPLFEPELRSVFTLPQGAVFIDIGAHIGKWSIFVARQNPENRVYAIDANKYTYAYLEENIALNALDTQITPINVGISSKSGTIEFDYDTVNTGTSGIGLGKTGDGIEKIQVEVMPFDVLSKNYNIPKEKIALIKIDVEGHEYEVFQGMKEFLTKKTENLTIICEIHPTNPKKDEILKLMNSFGFSLRFVNLVDHIFYK